MSLKSIFTLFFLFIFLNLQAQKETWHWYFGSKAGIDFSSGVPVADTSSMMGAPEGVSSISDSAGNLLFYTNGLKVWNKIHQVMENGDSLMGHQSSTQSFIIIKQPNKDSIYYIFTQDAGDSYVYTPPHKGFRYSTVNINFNNGLCKIINKNIFITDSTTERVTVIKHCNGKDYWIITQKKNCNTYYSYILSNNGISTIPIISQTNVILPNAESIGCGYMKASPNGDKIAVAFCTENMLGTNAILLNFDNSLGLLSNPISVGCPAASTLQGYGLEFSSNQKFLYVSYILPSGSSTSQIYQYNISSNDSAIISQTGVRLYWGYDTITFTHLESSGALQMACDHKIYIAFAGYPYVGVINSPDSAGLGCGFVKNGVYLNGRICNFGLPTFFPGFFNIISDYTYTQHCLNFNFSGVCDTASLVSVSWNFGDLASGINNTSTLFNPLHRFSDTGSYTVRVYYNYPCRTDSVVKMINVQLPPYVFPQSYITDTATALCKQLIFMPVCDSASLDSLIWNFGDVASGASNSSITYNPLHTFTSVGNYQVKLILYAYCRTDTVYKMINVNLPNVYLGADTTICNNATLVLNSHIQTELSTSFHWQNGDTSSTFTVTQAGTYFVEVNAGGCLFSDTIHIYYQHTPNVTLPNDTVICEDSRIDINIPQGDYSLLWDDGVAAFSRSINETGSYWVTATNQCGSSIDYFNLILKSCNCYLYFPNAFSPNADNKNDCFEGVYDCEFESYQLDIFDRWGELIFSTTNPSDCWDGKYKNKVVMKGVYVWHVEYNNVYNKTSITKRGTVTVVK